MQDSDTQSRQSPDAVRDRAGALLVLIALALPWNTQFGAGVPGSHGWMFALLLVATAITWASVVLTQRRLADPTADREGLSRLRLLLNAPYLALMAATVVYSIIGTVVLGGSGDVAPGVGPGAWFGLAGALLCAQPVFGNESSSGPRERSCRIIADASVGLSVLAACFNLYWRLRFVVPDLFSGNAVGQNLAVTVTALLYTAAALTPIVLVARWLRRDAEPDRLATTLLAAATLAAGALVWWLPAGREIDGFHGIAQSTTTSFVGFEGYLAWVAVAAIGGPLALLRAGTRTAPDVIVWRGAVRKSLLLIAVWAGVSAVLRIADLVLSGVLELPVQPYDKIVLLVFDLMTAVLSGWLVRKGFTHVPRLAARVMLTGLLALTVCRVLLGVALVPRSPSLVPQQGGTLFGNDLAQQITSTFDVTLCMLALLVLVLAMTVLNHTLWVPRRVALSAKTPARPVSQPGEPRIARGQTSTVATHSEPVADDSRSATPEAPRIAGPRHPRDGGL